MIIKKKNTLSTTWNVKNVLEYVEMNINIK